MLCRSGEEVGVCQHWMIPSSLTAKPHVFRISEIYYFFPKTICKMEMMTFFLFQFRGFVLFQGYAVCPVLLQDEQPWLPEAHTAACPGVT